MLADFYIPRLSNDMKLNVQKNHLGVQMYKILQMFSKFCITYCNPKLEIDELEREQARVTVDLVCTQLLHQSSPDCHFRSLFGRELDGLNIAPPLGTQ